MYERLPCRSIKAYERPVLEKNYHTAAVMERHGLAFLFNIASAFFDRSMEGRLVIEDPVDPGHCQRDTGSIVKIDLAPSLFDFTQHMYKPIIKFVAGKFREL